MKDYSYSNLSFSDIESVRGKANLEKETLLFLNYVQEIMMDSQKTEIELSEILQAESTTKSIASQAFYHGILFLTLLLNF